MDMQKDMELKKSFQNPDRRHAIYPIIHGGVAANPSRAEHIEQLGFAGIVGNVPYGEGYPDDDAEWQRTSDGFREFLKRGMHVWIYDEKGYPSGTAGGAVTDMNPDFIAQGLYCYEYWRTLSGPGPYRADVPGDKLYRAMLLPLDGGEAIDVTDTQNEHGTLKMHIPKGEYHLFMMSSRRLFDGTHAAESYSEPRNYISLSDKAATEAFISVTHEKYAQKLQDEFGKGVLAFFTDEPSLIAWNIRTAVYPIVPWHRDYPAQFAAKYGYPIELAVVAVVTKRGPQMLKRRCDFWEFIGDSVAANYFGTIQEWCHAHGMKSSGHFLEEERLQAHVYNYGSMYKCGKRMDWPGIDQLASEPSQLMYSGSIPIARLLASFADVSGEQETFTEFSDHSSRMANRQIGIEWVRASVNWHFAMGINNFTSYYGWENFDEKDIPPLNTYTARLGGLLRRGRRDSRVAVLYPEAAMWATYTPSVTERAIDHSEATMRVNDTFAKVSWELLHRQIDFDYVDEDLLRDAELADGRLCYKARRYECVVLPAAHIMCRSTVDKLVKMLENGVGVVVVGDLPKIARESGLAEDFASKFAPFIGGPKLNIVPLTSGWTLPGMAKLTAMPRPVTIKPHRLDCVLTGAEGSGSIIDGEIISASMLSHVRILEDGSRIVFLTNMGGKTYDGELCVHGGKSAQIADPLTGDITPLETTADGDVLKMNIRLKPYAAFAYIVS